jgi:hypothetical protein
MSSSRKSSAGKPDNNDGSRKGSGISASGTMQQQSAQNGLQLQQAPLRPPRPPPPTLMSRRKSLLAQKQTATAQPNGKELSHIPIHPSIYFSSISVGSDPRPFILA